MKVVKKKSTPASETLSDKIENSLKKDNIKIPEYEDVDSAYLVLPKDITDISSKELGKYLNAFTQQKIWIRTVIGRTTLLLREQELYLDEKRAKIYAELPVKMSVKEKELKVLLEAKEAMKNTIYFEEKLNTLNDIVCSLEESIFVISREISRRGKDWEEANREDNVDKTWGRPGRRKI